MIKIIVASAVAAAVMWVPVSASAGTKITEKLLKTLTLDDAGDPVENILEVLAIKTERGQVSWIATVKEGQYSCSVAEADLGKKDAYCSYLADKDATYI